MSMRQAPSLSAWMLEHLVSAGRNEALEGDLLEEFESGRSSSWYSRQVLRIITIQWQREILDHRMAFVFATLWSMLAPTWLALVYSKDFRGLIATAERLDWPWSAICPPFLWLSMLLAFLWTGMLLFFCWTWAGTKHFTPHRFRRGFLSGTLILMPIWMATVALRVVLSPNYWLTMLFGCVPFFLATLCAIWSPSRNAYASGGRSAGPSELNDDPA
jgi:hypothetical protein